MTSSEDRIMMYYINLIAETEKREKEQQQQRSKDGHRAVKPPQDRRRPRPDTAPGADDRLGSSRKGRNKHGKEKKKKKTSFSSDKKSEKAKRKRPRQPEASSAPSSSSGLSCGGNGLIDDEELLIERRSTRNKFAIDDSLSLEEELHPKILTVSSGKLRDDHLTSKRTKPEKSKSGRPRGRSRKSPTESSTDGDPGERRRRRFRDEFTSSTDADDDIDSNLNGALPDWALEGAVRRSSRIREAREGSVVSDKSAGVETSTRRKRGRPKKNSAKTPSKKAQGRRGANSGGSKPRSSSKTSTDRRRASEVHNRSSWPSRSGELEIKVSTVAPLNSDIGFLRMEMDPKSGWSRSGIWRRRIGLERAPMFLPLPLQSHCRDSFI